MTPSELKAEVNKRDSFFFNPDTMKFFGDTMANYGVRSAWISVHNYGTVTPGIPAWELYRKQPVKDGRTNSVYFSVTTFEVLHDAKEST